MGSEMCIRDSSGTAYYMKGGCSILRFYAALSVSLPCETTETVEKHGRVYKIYSNPRPTKMSHMHVCSACAGYTQPGGPKRSMRGAVVLHNRQRVSPPPPPSHAPPVEPLHHSNGSHRQGSNFRRHFVPEYPLLQLLGCLDSMHRLDIQTS